MFSPRSIVRASVVALSVAVLAGNTPVMAVGSTTVVAEEAMRSVAMATPTPEGVDIQSSVEAPNRGVLAKRTERVIAPKVHVNYRQANAKFASKMVGVHKSAYTGQFFTKKAEAFRKCVVERESSGYYRVVGGGDLTGDGRGDYQGAYQMSPALAKGATYMMAKESKKAKDGLLGEIRDLRKKPANKWSRYWQDRAFFTVLNWDGHFSGAKHWAGGRWSC